MKKVLLATTLAISILMLAGCGSANSDSATPSTASSASTGNISEASSVASAAGTSGESTGLSDEAKTAMQDRITEYSKKPSFKEPGEPFDAKALMAGKKILTIPASSGNPFNQITSDLMAVVGKKVGLDVKVHANQGSTTEWIQGVDLAAAQGYNLVDLFAGPTPETMSDAIKAAQAKGVKVVSSHLTGLEQSASPVDANMGADYLTGGKILADWAILKTDGNVNAIIIVADEITSTESLKNGISSEFDTNAPQAKYKFINVPLPKWSTDIQTEVQNALSADPSINYVIAIYDSMTQYIVPAVEATGMTDKTKIIGFNGTPFVLDFIKSGKVEMTIGENLDWIAHAVIDYEMRLLAGKTVPQNENIPLYIWTSDNINDAMGTSGSAEFSTGYGDAYISGYEKLWMLK